MGRAGPARLAGGRRQRLPRPVCPRQPPPGAGGVVRLAARRPRVRRPKRPARRAGDHLDGPAGRPAVPGRRGADPARRVVRPVGLQPRRLARCRQDRVGRTRAARPGRAHRPLPPPRGLHGAGRVRRRRRRPLERLVDDGARSRHRGRGTTTCSTAFGIDPARLPPVVGADEPVGEITAAFAADTGLPPSTTVVCGCGDEMAATLGAGLAEPGAVCDVLGTAEPVCAVADRPLRDRTQIAECHPHAAPGRWLLESPGWASGASYRWFRDQLGGGPRLRRPERARRRGAGRRRRARLPAVDGRRDGPAVGGRRARRLVRADAGARPGPHGPGAARGIGLCASRRGRGDRRRGPRLLAHRLRRGRRPLAARPPDAGRRDGPSRQLVGGRRDDGPRRGDAGRGGIGAAPVDRRGRARRWRASRPRCTSPTRPAPRRAPRATAAIG